MYRISIDDERDGEKRSAVLGERWAVCQFIRAKIMLKREWLRDHNGGTEDDAKYFDQIITELDGIVNDIVDGKHWK